MTFVPGPILTSQYKVESWPGAKNESSFQTLNSAALIGMAYAVLGKQAEEMKTSCSADPPDSREKATRLISQLLQLLGLGRYVRFGTSVPGY